MATRYLYLIRHGQYLSSQHDDDRGGSLTDTGRTQADLTAEALEPLPVSAVYTSPMRRAFETAERIAARQELAPQSFDILREIIPAIPPDNEGFFAVRFPGLSADQVAEQRARGDQAFERFFRQLDTDEDTHEVIVCHGNIIRYFVCRVLGAPPELWVKMETNHCGITRCSIGWDGQMRLVSLNDTGHLPLSLQLFL